MRSFLAVLLFMLAVSGAIAAPAVQHRPDVDSGWVIPADQVAFPLKPAQVIYPDSALAAKQGAMVWVLAHLTPNGRVDTAQIAFSNNPNYGFNDLTLTAIRELEFDTVKYHGWVYVPFCYQPDEDTASERPSPDEFIPVEVQPEMVQMGELRYPASAKQAGLEGVVFIKALVGKDGRVMDARVARSSGVPVLDEAAIEQAWQNKFKPAQMKGEPVLIWVTYKVDFKSADTNHGFGAPAPDPHDIRWAVLVADSTAVDALPVIVSFKPVEYSSKARKNNEHGTVWVRTLVDAGGEVAQVELVESSGSKLLDEAVLKSARKNKYMAATKAGKSVECWVRYKVEF